MSRLRKRLSRNKVRRKKAKQNKHRTSKKLSPFLATAKYFPEKPKRTSLQCAERSFYFFGNHVLFLLFDHNERNSHYRCGSNYNDDNNHYGIALLCGSAAARRAFCRSRGGRGLRAR